MAIRTIFYPPELRAAWPKPLAREWRARYPSIFDDEDYRQTDTQPEHHFFEWLTAVHIFHTTGGLSLVEKAEFGATHQRKRGVVDAVLSPETQARLRAICVRNHVQWPDLLVYGSGRRRVWFAEAKGPTDTVADEQIASHREITRELSIPVHVYQIVPRSV